MVRFESIRNIINTFIRPNGKGEITGETMNNVLQGMLDDIDSALEESGATSEGGNSGGDGVSTLAGLTDVKISSLADGQSLVYDSATGMWRNRSVSGGQVTSENIISALGYTPFDSDAFTKPNIQSILGIKGWALAAAKPSYTFAEITSKPTTLSGYGITDAYTKTNADAKFLQQAGGTITGDVIVNTKLTSTVIEALQFKADGKLIMHRNAGSENFYLNYGGASERMYLYASTYGFHIGASRERAFTIDSNKDANFAANLTVVGNMYSKNFPQGKSFSQDPTSSFISTMFGADAVGDAIYRTRIVKTGGTGFDGVCSPYSPMLVVKSTDTHGYISFGYNDYGRTHCYIGGGNADKINWSGILFHNNMHLLPKTDITYDLGESSYRWKGVYANNLYASSLYGPKPSGGSYNQYRILYSGGGLYLQAGSDDGTATSGIVTVSGINVASLNEFRVFATKSYYTGNVEVNGTAAFAQTIYATGNITTAGELNAKNYMIGQYLPSAPLDSFATAIFGKSDSDICKMRLQQSTVAIDGVASQYSPVLAVKTFSSHGFISFGYNNANKDKCYIGAGNGDAINWSGILFHNNMNLTPKTDNTYSLGDSSYRWKEVNAVSIKIGDATITWDASARMLKADKGIYSTADIVAGK